MFEIEKGSMRFLIFYTGAAVCVKLTATSEYSSPRLLYTIRHTITTLANYHLKNTDADYKKGFLKQYFAHRGWNIKIYKSQLSQNDLGEMRVS